jgi:signal transduction histidine kinase
MELLENACRHGTDERPVRIAVRKEGTGARVLVANTGPIIPTGSSQGLGLPIVRWVAEIHGGSVEIEWRDPLNLVTLDLPSALSPAF